MNAHTQSSNSMPDNGNRPSVLLRVAFAAAVGAAILLAILTPPKPAGMAAAVPQASEPRIVGQAQASAVDAASVQAGSGMPPPSATATDGNVVDLTY